MKTKKQIKTEAFNQVINHPEYFKKSYSKKMGGMQTIVLEGAGKFEFDDRQYYSGRGAKYNNVSMHEDLGEIFVSKKHMEELADKITNARWEMQKNEQRAKKQYKESYYKASALIGKKRLDEGIEKIKKITDKAYYLIENVMLYHGYKSEHISIDIITDEERAKFNWDEWASAPHAANLGMTETDKNLFVC